MLTALLCKLFPYKEIGWKDIEEVFYRWTVLRTPWFRVYIHKLDAPIWHKQCHDHPWNFLAIILAGGYWEIVGAPARGRSNHGRRVGRNTFWRGRGSILYRPAKFAHNVATERGIPNWSLVIISPKQRDWGYLECERE